MSEAPLTASALSSSPIMGLFSSVIDSFAPIFLMASPITSYADQIHSIHRTKSSAGFSLDIPLIMLVASILKVFYWFGAYYSHALLFQAVLMIAVQLVLLKVALDNRPVPGGKGGLEHVPFSALASQGSFLESRPYNFWQWRATRPYYQFLVYMTVTLLAIHVILTPLSRSSFYISLLGYSGLAVEATLPLPQIITNQRAQSCKGFRLSVIINWLAGDAMKMSYFFFSNEYIPWAFRLCGIFQACCDCYLGIQYWMFGEGQESKPVASDIGDMAAMSMSEKDDRFR